MLRFSVCLNPSKILPYISLIYSCVIAFSYIVERELMTGVEGGFGEVKGLVKLSSKVNICIALEFDKYAEIVTIIR